MSSEVDDFNAGVFGGGVGERGGGEGFADRGAGDLNFECGGVGHLGFDGGGQPGGGREGDDGALDGRALALGGELHALLAGGGGEQAGVVAALPLVEDVEGVDLHKLVGGGLGERCLAGGDVVAVHQSAVVPDTLAGHIEGKLLPGHGDGAGGRGAVARGGCEFDGERGGRGEAVGRALHQLGRGLGLGAHGGGEYEHKEGNYLSHTTYDTCRGHWFRTQNRKGDTAAVKKT